MDEIQVQPSSSTEVLDLLLGAGLDRVEAANLLAGATVPGQRPSMHGGLEDQRSSSPLVGEQSVPQTATKTFETTVMETLARFGEKLEYLTARVEGSDTSTAIAPSETPQRAASSRDWADRPLDEPADYTASITWMDEEPADADNSVRPLVQVSEGTARAIKTAFKGPLLNTARLQTRKGYSFPDVEDTKCPKLDRVIKQNLSKEVKEADAAAAKLQTLTLDAVAPLVHILEEAQKGTLSIQSAAEAAKSALVLLGNASAHMTKERRKKVVKDLNKDLLPLAEDSEVFEEAAPLLFGSSFERKMKEHLESLKCLRKSLAPKAGSRGDQFFRGSRPYYPSRGGGSNYRGRGGQRYQPYFHRRGGKESQQPFQRKGP